MTRTRKILFGTVAAVGLGTAAFAASGVGSQTLNTPKRELISSAAAAAPGGFRGHRHGGGHGMMRVCVGKLVAARAVEKGITEVVFDRGPYLYHGRVKALADAAREGGLAF